MKNKKTISILVVIALCIAVIAMNSYAFWSITATQSGTNVVGSGCFDLSFTEGDAISLGSQFPIIDADSETLSPYTFTITNTCNIYASYQVNLEVLPVQGTETKLDDQYVKVSLNNTDKKILTEHEEVSTTITGAITSYKLTTGELAEDESITYDLREWLEENTPLSQASTSFRSMIVLIAVPSVGPAFLAKELLSNPHQTFVFWGGPIRRDTVEEMSFTTTNEVPAGVIGSWDVGEEKNGKVIAWYTDTDANNKYEVVVGAEGGVYAPENSTSIFRNFENLNSLDLTSFNTSEASIMREMFSNTGNNYIGFVLDLGDKFDTSNVTDMGNMFYQTGYHASNFTLDLRDNFDTSKATDMSGMFFQVGYSNPAFTLNLGDNFDTSKVTNMEFMFQNIGRSNPNFSLDLRQFIVSAVMLSNSATFMTNNTSHKIYASNSNISFMSGKGFTGTIINCTTTPASCPQ